MGPPADFPVSRPELATVAMLVSEEVHVTEAVKSVLAPSEYMPVADSCKLKPAATEAELELTSID